MSMIFLISTEVVCPIVASLVNHIIGKKVLILLTTILYVLDLYLQLLLFFFTATIKYKILFDCKNKIKLY